MPFPHEPRHPTPDTKPAEMPERLPIEFLEDIPVWLDIDLGETEMTIRDIIELEEGSIIELEKSAGDNVEIKIKGVPVALGEIFVIEGAIGIRITEIVSDDHDY